MKNLNYLFFGAFVLMVAAQWFIPASMVWESESAITKGKVYKFKTVPVDPNDPFRGKYVRLGFEAETYRGAEENFTKGEEVFALLEKDLYGFVMVSGLSNEKPEDHDFIKVKIAWMRSGNNSQIRLQFPFERFYMEESKAPAAEKVYREAARDSTSLTWAVVSVHNGNAVLQDVMINGRSLKELAEVEVAARNSVAPVK